MPLKLSQLNAFASRCLGGASTESDLTHTIISNAAGQWLYGIRAWKFRERAPLGVHFTANQQYATLPPDVGEVYAYAMEGLTQDASFTTFQEIARFRDYSITPTGFQWWLALVRNRRDSTFDVPNNPRLEIYPTPLSASDDLKLWYSARWSYLQNDEEYADVPDYCEPTLISAVQAFAEGWIEDDSPYPSARLEEIVRGQIFKAAVRQDGALQPDYGRLQGGAVQQGQGVLRDIGYLPWTEVTLT